MIITTLYGAAPTSFIHEHTSTKCIDRIAVFLFSIANVYPVVNIINGSFVGIFATFLALGWLLTQSKRNYGGALWSLASIVKGYPAFWGNI
jgi:hypothetical protein